MCINDATIVTTDIEISNGVIHVIDAVILPPAAEEPAVLPVTGSSSATNWLSLGVVLAIILALGAATLSGRLRLNAVNIPEELLARKRA